MNFYDKLIYTTEKTGDSYNWLGNLRWYTCEEKPGCFSFQCISCLPEMTHEECLSVKMTKELFKLNTSPGNGHRRVLGADYIMAGNTEIFMPFYEYGSLISSAENTTINFEGEARICEDVAVIKTGSYFVAVKTEKISFISGFEALIIAGKHKWAAISFGVDEKTVILKCRDLYKNREKILAENREFWNNYLKSCPTVSLTREYIYEHKELGISENYSSDEFLKRQLWHYWCMLVNVSEVEFNKFPLYMAPDKINWKGTWSNDGPQCMAALSLTNQKDLSKRLIISYLTNAMTNNGEFSWYMHADGVGCYGKKGDVGRFSHGDPYMPQVVEYYIKNTDDETILSADAGGMTVYEKLKKYVLNLHNLRDINNDSLIEWANLWETGWDDKGGTFFTSASLTDWMKIISGGTDKEISDFYKKNQRPVIAVVEQVITMWSLAAMSRIASRKNDNELKEYCNSLYLKMADAVNSRCWNEKDGFYYDIDVKTGHQTTEKSADAFYWMNFEKNPKRAGALLEHLNNENEFNCYYVPMLSKDSVGFNQFGYWSGGHWPREMSIIAMGLHNCGFDEKAKELLIRAIMVAKGNIIPEVRNPLNGQPSTQITKMACSIMNIIALLDVSGKICWCEKN